MFDAYEQVYLFMERGGDVLYAIMFVIFLLWLLIIERLAYFSTAHKTLLKSAINEWEARTDRTSWKAHQIRHDLICTVEMGLESNLSLIKMLVD